MTIKNLILTICLGILTSPFILAQYPTSFTVSGCTTDANGNYIQGEDVGGCPCYENQSSSGVIYNSGTSWNADISGDCANLSGSYGTIFNQTSCDITESTAAFCDPADITNVVYPAPAPISFTITGCGNSFNGDYIQAEDANNCACYEQQTGSGNGIIFSNGSTWLFSFDSNDCANPALSSTSDIFTQTSCDITESTTVAFGCELADLVNVVYPSTINSIPTTGEWGLIVLMLLLMSFGTVAIIRFSSNPSEVNR